ncbi:MAG TPA: MgtC/SapB family protein [Tepidiformaceae bacterium]|nr:MgtC/SapB family protein [Tepidiformaceae bacterium]
MSVGEQTEIYLWILFAFALGALVGLEREYRGHEAGIRTSALVCGGAAAFALIGRQIGEDRVAAAVVQGVGFLGAGLVFQRGHSVRGVTTAATIWVLAAVGVVVSQELWFTAILVVATLIVLLELAPVSNWVLRSSIKRGSVHTASVFLDQERDRSAREKAGPGG